VLPDLDRKDVDLEHLAGQALGDLDTLVGLVEGLCDKRERVGYDCLRALLLVAEEAPEMLYPHWDTFQNLLVSENTYFKLRGANLIAATIVADADHRFESILDDYFALLDDRSVIAACYVAANAGPIARAKPHLRGAITDRLFGIDATHHPAERRDLIKGHAVEAFGEFFQESEEQTRILQFVRAQVASTSPRTRKAAQAFLKRWAEPA
jgi:hypothetical protein